MTTYKIFFACTLISFLYILKTITAMYQQKIYLTKWFRLGMSSASLSVCLDILNSLKFERLMWGQGFLGKWNITAEYSNASFKRFS